MRLLTTSPIEIMPPSLPPSTTGRWRTRCSVISAMSSASVSRGAHVLTDAVMNSLTGLSSALGPPSATARTMSRSDTMPPMRPCASTMTTAPIFLAERVCATASTVSPGCAVITARPLALRICATVMQTSFFASHQSNTKSAPLHPFSADDEKAEKPGNKAAEMRFPGDAAVIGETGQSLDASEQRHAEEDKHEDEGAPIAQDFAEAQRCIGFSEHNGNGGGKEPRDGSRYADDRYRRVRIAQDHDERAAQSRSECDGEEAQRSEMARHRRPEDKKPHRIEQYM